jgi:hypothetical protein
MIGCRACNRAEKGAALEAAGEDMVREDWHCKWLVFSIGGVGPETEHVCRLRGRSVVDLMGSVLLQLLGTFAESALALCWDCLVYSA